MKREVLGQFATSPDRQAAEAFSEYYLRMADFKLATTSMDSDGEFPPVPAWYTAACAAYLEDLPSGEISVRRQFVMTPLGGHQPDAIAEAFISEYKSKVGEFHKIEDYFKELDPQAFNLGNLILRTLQLTEETQLRTVATFVIHSARDSDEHFGALVIPRKVFTELPLEDRDQWLHLMKSMDRLLESSDEMSEEMENGVKKLRHNIGPILRNEPVHGNFAFFAAATQLPRIDIVERAVLAEVEQMENRDKDRYQGLSRNERRKLAHQERRQARKKK